MGTQPMEDLPDCRTFRSVFDPCGRNPGVLFLFHLLTLVCDQKDQSGKDHLTGRDKLLFLPSPGGVGYFQPRHGACQPEPDRPDLRRIFEENSDGLFQRVTRNRYKYFDYS